MPSRMRRTLDPQSSFTRSKQIELSESREVPVLPPFKGFTPDLNPSLIDWTFCPQNLGGLVQIGGALRTIPGFERLDADSLPLGTPSAEPVVGLHIHRDVLVTPGQIRRYAVTADSTLGQLYELNSNWTNITYTGAGAGFSGNTAAAGGVGATLCDVTFFALDNRLIFANGFDPVYTHTPGGATYTDFSPASLNPFKARSVESAFDRIFFLNTSEGGTQFPVRLRGTTRSASPSLTGLGSVTVDFTEIDGEALAVRKLRNSLMVYFRRGIAVCRETDDIAVPIIRDYVSRYRGLLGTFSMCDLGDEHFLICNDGWFRINERGDTREVGLVQVEGQVFPKWRQHFYRTLNSKAAHRIYCAFDRLHHVVWIVWPSGVSNEPNEVWAYDIETDSVWPVTQCFPLVPNVLAYFASLEQAVTWDTITTTWDTTTPLWASLAISEGLEMICYGTTNGLVMNMNPNIVTVDGFTPAWQYGSVFSNLGSPELVKTFERFTVSYGVQATNPGQIAVTIQSDEGPGVGIGSDTMTFQQLTGSSGNRISDYVTSRRSGHTLGFTLSGMAPTILFDMKGHIRPIGITRRKLS